MLWNNTLTHEGRGDPNFEDGKVIGQPSLQVWSRLFVWAWRVEPNLGKPLSMMGRLPKEPHYHGGRYTKMMGLVCHTLAGRLF